MSKIAIIQDNIAGGGRLTVLLEIVKILNERGITPTLIVRKNTIDREYIKEKYELDVDFRAKEIWAPRVYKLNEVNILLFNFFANFHLRTFDYIINTNNTLCLSKKGKRVFAYIHYPRKDRVLRFKDIHSYGTQKMKPITKIGKILEYGIAVLFYLFERIDRNTVVLTNSEFSKEAILRRYGKLNVEVIYPGVNTTDFLEVTEMKKEQKIASVGSFSEFKGQFEQIRIAEKMSNYRFLIMGFANSEDSYFKKCVTYLNENDITNVELMPNLDLEEMIRNLGESKYFLHSMWNEPFGITTVQAIAAGCIPIVPDSGGQKEIVKIAGLRYTRLDELPEIIKKIESQDQSEIYSQLRSGLELYDRALFRRKIKIKLDGFLNNSNDQR